MPKLYLIRHGLTEWNKTNRFQGSSNILLCEEGIKQAKKLSERLKYIEFDAIYASDLDRAYMTAYYIAMPHNKGVTKLSELREIHFGEWEGLTQEEIIDKSGVSFTDWRNAPHEMSFPGEGHFKNVQKRVMQGMQRIIDCSLDGNIAVVSHGGSLKIIILSLMQLELSFYRHFWLGNTSLSIIDVREDRNVLCLLNDMSHLEV